MSGTIRYESPAERRHVHAWTVPDATGSLYEWTRADIPVDPFLLSRYCNNLVVWAEQQALRGAPALDTERDERDARRLEVRLLRYALRHRPALDDTHRQLLWVARGKLAHLLHNVVGLDADACRRYEADAVARESWSAPAAAADADADYLDWLDRHGQPRPAAAAAAGDTTLHLWKRVAVLLDRWTRMPYAPELWRLVRELGHRVAFFFSHKEPAALSAGGAANGLLWRIVLNGRGASRVAGGGGAAHRALLTQPLFRRTSADGRTACVNEDFVAETERVFFHMEQALWRCAGFQWAEWAAEHAPAGCAACAAVGDWRPELSEPPVHAAVREKTEGAYAQFIEQEFQARVWALYLQPGEMERFAMYNRFDEQKPAVCLSKLRETTYGALATRLTNVPPVHAWDALAAAAAAADGGGGGGGGREPAYDLMALLALDYECQRALDGVGLADSGYAVGCTEMPVWSPCTPASRHRVLDQNVYRTGHNTGSLAYQCRHRLLTGQKQAGRRVARAMHYQHPVMLKLLGSWALLHRGVLHRCEGGLAHALTAWIRCFCEDDQLLGRLPNGASLTGLYARFAPDRAQRAAAIELEQRERVEELRPVFIGGGRRPEPPPALDVDDDGLGYF